MQRRTLVRLTFQAKAILCILLTLNINVWLGGCAGQAGPLPTLDGKLLIPLGPDHPLNQSLQGSAFGMASAVEIDLNLRTARFIFPAADRAIEASYAGDGRDAVLTGVSFTRQGNSAAFTLNDRKEIVKVRTHNGLEWKRPTDWQSAADIESAENPFVAANGQLLEMATQFDAAQASGPQNQAGGSTSGNVPLDKSDASLPFPFAEIFVVVALIWAYAASIMAVLLALLLFFFFLQLLLSFLGQPAPEPIPNSNGNGNGNTNTNANTNTNTNGAIDDCDGDGVADADEIAAGAADCNSNGIPDACDIADGAADCDGNNIPDSCDIAEGAADCDNNNVPDVCQPDADDDGLIDSCDTCANDAANDADGDGVCGNLDNCPGVANAGQVDLDQDGAGDACDPCPLDAANDADGDGLCGDADNCPDISNAAQTDTDTDGLGDECDVCPLDVGNDADGDGVCEGVDNCPDIANAGQSDGDGDGVGDDCDNCMAIFNPDQTDTNQNGIGDACDTQACCFGEDLGCLDLPVSSCENGGGVPLGLGTACGDSGDCDQNGTPDACQLDSDVDGLIDACDPCPQDAANDADGDTVCESQDNCPDLANAGQEDDDDDGIGDACDNCPNVPNAGQEDADGDNIGDACETQACCLNDDTCVEATLEACALAGGTPQGANTLCQDVVCDTPPEPITVSASADRDWVYEHLAAGGTACEIAFTGSIVDDPENNTSYTFTWSTIPPVDVPGAAFTEITDDGMGQATYRPPARPAWSPSGALYTIQLQITGDQAGNSGVATFTVDVRVLGDVDGDGCTDAADRQIVNDIEDGDITDPDLIEAADVNCDGFVDALDAQVIQAIETGAIDMHGAGVCP